MSTEISDLKDDHKDIIKAIDNKNELENQVSEKQDQLKTLSSKISSSKEELSKLAGQVTAAAGVPKTLSAGKYTVGKDVKAGRYKATPIGDGSNFIVYDGDDPIVNTVLGSDGEASYTFECDEGNIIQTESAVKLTPVK
ncbi:MAG: hypothetical protein LKI80_14310 [Sporolactobacillus sp.]|nr:hypothetical protein [Sporolactobacillus sp.]